MRIDKAGAKEWAGKARKWLGKVFLQLARVAFALLLLWLAQRVVAEEVSTDEAFVAGGLAAAALLALTLTPSLGRVLLQRISKLSLGPFAVELIEETEKAAASTAADAEEAKEGRVRSVLELRLKIERKLAYVAKHVLDEDGHPTFLTIGSLKYDKLLPAGEANLVNRLMTLRDEDVRALSPAEQDEFFTAADKIARSIRASVLNCLVAKLLREPATPEDRAKLEGWTVKKKSRRAGSRPDWVAEKEGRKYRIAPTFATDADSEILAKARKRLSPGAKGEGSYEKRIIVIPHHSKSGASPDADPAVVKTDKLVDALAAFAAAQEVSEAADPGPGRG